MPTLARNRKAFHEYEILEKFEGGLVLSGPEVKSAKAGRIQLKGAFVSVHKGELWLKNAFVAKYPPAGGQPDYDPYRDRKVLVHKRQLKRFIGKGKSQGLTLVPLSVYTKRNLVKLSFALARGKREYEKREKIKKREADRKMRRLMKGKIKGDI